MLVETRVLRAAAIFFRSVAGYRDDVQAFGTEAKPVPPFNQSKLIALGFVEPRAGLLLVTEKGKTRLSS